MGYPPKHPSEMCINCMEHGSPICLDNVFTIDGEEEISIRELLRRLKPYFPNAIGSIEINHSHCGNRAKVYSNGRVEWLGRMPGCE